MAVQMCIRDRFYWVPLFGWIKMILVSYIASSWGLMLLGIGLLLISCMAAYLLLCGYKGDFVERAMQDAQEFTALYKDCLLYTSRCV